MTTVSLDEPRARWRDLAEPAVRAQQERVRTAHGSDRKALVDFSPARTDCGDNWDLVDGSVYAVLGPWLLEGDPGVLDEPAASSWLWDRRIAVVASRH